MQPNDLSIRALAVALAAIIVAGAMLALARSSDANFRESMTAASERYEVQPMQVALEPSRIEVVGVRGRVRAVARADERTLPES